MSLKYTRAIIDLIHNGELKDAEFENFPIFNFRIPKAAKNIPSEILNPRNTWMYNFYFIYLEIQVNLTNNYMN